MTAVNHPPAAANSVATFAAPENAVEHAIHYSSQAMRALTECQGKYASFVSKRISEDMAMPGRLAGCKSPMEVIDVWADFYRTAMEQYADHARSMTQLGQEAIEEVVRETEVEAAEAAAAVSKTLEETTGVKAVSDNKTKAA